MYRWIRKQLSRSCCLINTDHIKKNRSNTAILLFAQTAKADALHKPLAHNSQVMEVLNDRVRKTVRDSGFDFYHFTENEQRGVGFGNRFTNSIQDVLDKGYESVICLGNDTPLLTVQLVRDAATALKKGKAVKGKSLDGGLYLIGLHKNKFDPVAFKALSWQSSGLAVAFHDYIASQNQELIVLEALADIDTDQDLVDFLAGKDARSSIIKLLLLSFSRKRNYFRTYAEKSSFVPSKQPLNKGSPLAA
jgi:glycosyltransferase A (GT-A) superfamily protein (DUF2064 family)